MRAPLRVGTDVNWLRPVPGQQYTCGIKRDSSVWCWGQNVASGSDEGFPLGIDGAELDTPTRVPGAPAASSLSTSVFHTCAVGANAELSCWGRNIEGQLGAVQGRVLREPTVVLSGVARVSVSWFTTCVLTVAGGVECSGKNENGELGTGGTERPLAFTPALLP